MVETINLHKLAIMVVLYEGHNCQHSLFNGHPLHWAEVRGQSPTGGAGAKLLLGSEGPGAKPLLGSENSVLGAHWGFGGKAPARVSETCLVLG
jgi:hypothetical protein